MYQVVSYEEFAELRAEFAQVKAELAQVKAALPDWLREAEAQQHTGLSQATLARERKKPGTLLVWKTEGGLRYLRRSLDAFNEARLTRRARFAQAA